MKIGIPRETKPMEGRVALVPAAVADLVKRGHSVTVQQGAGVLSGYDDSVYQQAGAQLAENAETVFREATLIVKVKEPIRAEYALLKPDHILFSYLHLAAVPELAEHLVRTSLTAIAFETVMVDNQLPLLAPMSDVAGRVAVQIGTTLLQRQNGGNGILLGGLPAAHRGHVVIIGAGNAGSNAAIVARGLGANVTVFDRQRAKSLRMRELGDNVTALYPYHDDLARAVADADLVIGAVLTPGAKAPHIVTREMVRSMRPGSAIIDIAVDQGGCVETTRPTDYTAPTYVEEGVIHFAVTNIPAAVPRSASQALSAEVAPYAMLLAEGQLDDNPALQQGINIRQGRIVHPAVAASLEQS
ncbi:MAG TPA: alanine dehydrogenase [Gammaproteobacteria bacterium]|nr:alanine dehydrogenase [Gammaproteobacteria bacterium]